MFEAEKIRRYSKVVIYYFFHISQFPELKDYQQHEKFMISQFTDDSPETEHSVWFSSLLALPFCLLFSLLTSPEKPHAS